MIDDWSVVSTSQNISTGTLAYRFLVRKCWVGKNGGLASLGSTWHLTHHFLMQWSPGLMCRLAKWPLSSVAQNSCLQMLCFSPREQWPLGASCPFSQELVIFHRITWFSWSSFIHLIHFFSAWCFTYSEMKQHGQLNLCHSHFSHEISQWSFLFSMGRKKNLASIWWEV